jgi:malonyl-CoA O-methyltransferase
VSAGRPGDGGAHPPNPGAVAGPGGPLGPREAYELWAATYAQTGDNPLADAVDRAVWRVLPDVAGLTILDAGCGLGRWSARIAAGGGGPIGIDLVEAMLRASDGRFARAVADVHRLPFMAAFDGAICSLVLSHLPEVREPLFQLAEALRPGAWLVVADIHPDTAALGWRRTFADSSGRSHEVVWAAHPLDYVRAALGAAGLRAGETVEERLEEAALPARLAHAAGVPAAYAMAARKV